MQASDGIKDGEVETWEKEDNIKKTKKASLFDSFKKLFTFYKIKYTSENYSRVSQTNPFLWLLTNPIIIIY